MPFVGPCVGLIVTGPRGTQVLTFGARTAELQGVSSGSRDNIRLQSSWAERALGVRTGRQGPAGQSVLRPKADRGPVSWTPRSETPQPGVCRPKASSPQGHLARPPPPTQAQDFCGHTDPFSRDCQTPGALVLRDARRSWGLAAVSSAVRRGDEPAAHSGHHARVQQGRRPRPATAEAAQVSMG